MNQQPTSSPIRGKSATTRFDELMVTSPQQMLDILDVVGRSLIAPNVPDASELLAEEAVDPKNPRLRKARYFLVAKTFRASVKGVLTKMGVAQFERAVAVAVKQKIADLNSTWAGDWQVVAIEREIGGRHRLNRRAKEDPARALAAQAARALDESTMLKHGKSRTTPDLSQSENALVLDEDVILHFAVADLSQRDLYDPLAHERPGNTAGVFHVFGETGYLRDLPPVFKRSRDAAKEIIEAYYGKERKQVEVSAQQRGQILDMASVVSAQQIARALVLPVEIIEEVLAAAEKAEEKPAAKGRKAKAKDATGPAPTDTLEGA